MLGKNIPCEPCEIQDVCPFWQAFHERQASFWRVQLGSYCLGPLGHHCRRRDIYQATGTHPPLYVFPSGEMPESFLTIS